ncbi:MAG: hypothetical protein EZS28_051298 [Streblomastix strix]|uniref:Uncharacterized protein n=1 Tax=Streblomastix strix TaxID=222440 RepID=A0A5J4T3Y7_9EUKA|nr:MAG: hypothetical protein EZS28_051298 [Streblomastix strix]
MLRYSRTSYVYATTLINYGPDKIKCADSFVICSSSLMISSNHLQTEGSGMIVSSNIDDLRLVQIQAACYDSFSNGESTSAIERIAAVSLGEQISFTDVGYRSRQVIDGEMLLKTQLQFNYFVFVHEDQAKN